MKSFLALYSWNHFMHDYIIVMYHSRSKNLTYMLPGIPTVCTQPQHHNYSKNHHILYPILHLCKSQLFLQTDLIHPLILYHRIDLHINNSVVVLWLHILYVIYTFCHGFQISILKVQGIKISCTVMLLIHPYICI